MPQLKNDSFNQTVTLIYQHDDTGALGIVINRLSGHTFADIFFQLNITATSDPNSVQPIFDGGPVHKEYGLVIHSSEQQNQWESTHAISTELSLTSSQDILHAIAEGEGPEKVLMSLGYAGWGPGQLEDEMMDNAWLTTPVELDILFDTEVQNKWLQAAALIGVDYTKLTHHVGHA